MFERPLILWLLILAPLVAVPGIVAIRRGRRATGGVAIALRLLLFAVLVVMAAGLRIAQRTVAQRMAMVVAVDRSRSIAPDQLDWTRARVAALARAMDRRDRLAVLAFGRDPRLVTPFADPEIAGPLALARPRSTRLRAGPGRDRSCRRDDGRGRNFPRRLRETAPDPERRR